MTRNGIHAITTVSGAEKASTVRTSCTVPIRPRRPTDSEGSLVGVSTIGRSDVVIVPPAVSMGECKQRRAEKWLASQHLACRLAAGANSAHLSGEPHHHDGFVGHDGSGRGSQLEAHQLFEPLEG